MNNTAPSNAGDRMTLKKTLSPLHVWALALGSIIGWGCFVLPGIRFLPQAGPMASCIGFFLGAFLLVFIALCYGKMIENYPVAGGEFAYAYAGFGMTASFICGWALVLGYLCIIALNGTALALLTRFLVPGFFEWGYLYTVADWQVYAGELLFISAVLLFFGVLNYRGGDIVGGIQLALIVVLVGGIVALGVAAFLAPTSKLSNFQPLFSEGRSYLNSIAVVVAIAPWLYVGFDTIPQAAEEFDFPPEKSTALMISAILAGAVCYGAVTLIVAGVIPYPELLAQTPVWATGTIAELILGRAGSVVLALAVLAAICTGINGFYMATTRLIFGMARAKFLPKSFESIHPRFKTPHIAVFFTISLCLLAPWFGRKVLDWIVEMSAVGTVIAFLFSCLTAYRFMAANAHLPGSGLNRFYAVCGSLASILCLALLTIPGSPAGISIESWFALLGWAALGAIFYLSKLPELRVLSVQDLSYLILGNRDQQVFFKKKCKSPQVRPQDCEEV